MKIINFVKIITCNVVLLVILFILAEVMIRLWMPDYVLNRRRYPTQHRVPASSPYKKDVDLGWVLNREHPSFGKNGIYCNMQGFRDHKDFDSIYLSSNKRRILVLGNSYVFGLHVRHDATLPSLLQNKLGEQYEVFNLSMPGWGLDQMYLAYKKYAPIIRPEMVILIFIYDDILRIFEAERTLDGVNEFIFDMKIDKLSLRKHKPNVFENLCQKSYILNILYKIGYRGYYSKRIAELIFSELIEHTKRRKERLIVIRYPLLREIESHIYFPIKYFFNFRNLFRKKDTRYFELHGLMATLSMEKRRKLYLPSEHPTEAGYRYLADYIYTNFFRNIR